MSSACSSTTKRLRCSTGIGIEDEIERALQSRVALRSGGHLVIEQTEAMTTIDVNTGAYVGARNLEDTVFRTNLEAAAILPRQLRLRNLGGIVVVDFIDMEDEEHRRQVLRTLEKACEADPARIRISGVSRTRTRADQPQAHPRKLAPAGLRELSNVRRTRRRQDGRDGMPGNFPCDAAQCAPASALESHRVESRRIGAQRWRRSVGRYARPGVAVRR